MLSTEMHGTDCQADKQKNCRKDKLKSNQKTRDNNG